jgi:hypothetical protein
MSLDAARAVADAVLYEGYLLYPYRASSAKNRSRWQFGVLGPPAAAASAFGEPPGMALQCLLTPGGHVTVHLRFLHLQVRVVERWTRAGGLEAVPAVTVGGQTILSWDEAVEHEVTLPEFTTGSLDFPVTVPAAEEIEPLPEEAGRLVRRRYPLTARVRVTSEPAGDLTRLTVTVTNEHPDPVAGKETAVRHSLLGAHLLLEARDAAFISVVDPPASATTAAAGCTQDRCWPVLAGPPGTTGLLLGAPIILYDHPQVADESPGALFDLTEIDEILTLRVMTMTDDEKAEARATDPRARAIIDRCDAMSPAELQQLHGARRDEPGPFVDAVPSFSDLSPADDVPWWDPAADASVDPARDTVEVGGVAVGRDSLVLLRPARRADAQDFFLAGRLARVTAVLSDVDGGTHVAVVLTDDPAADLHDWYGRYYYFAPDELEPAGPATEGENQS